MSESKSDGDLPVSVADECIGKYFVRKFEKISGVWEMCRFDMNLYLHRTQQYLFSSPNPYESGGYTHLPTTKMQMWLMGTTALCVAETLGEGKRRIT